MSTYPQLKLNPEQVGEFRDALLSAFYTWEELEQMFYFKFKEDLGVYVQRAPLRTVAFELIRWANAEGRAGELVLKAHEYKPNNQDLRAFALALAAESAPEEVGPQLEAAVLRSVSFGNFEEWQKTIAERSRAVCLINTPAKQGTGFLVAPDVVMTCYHVIDDVDRNRDLRAQMELIFDFRTNEHGNDDGPVRECRLAEERWLLASSPEGELDYALLRLAQRPGEDVVAGGAQAPRGWLTMHGLSLEVGSPLLVIQHPDRARLKITGGSVRSRQHSPVRIVHTANTLGGSSGSPCMTFNLEVVAMHQAGDRVTGNRGIPFSEILPRLPGGLLSAAGG